MFTSTIDHQVKVVFSSQFLEHNVFYGNPIFILVLESFIEPIGHFKWEVPHHSIIGLHTLVRVLAHTSYVTRVNMPVQAMEHIELDAYSIVVRNGGTLDLSINYQVHCAEWVVLLAYRVITSFHPGRPLLKVI